MPPRPTVAPSEASSETTRRLRRVPADQAPAPAPEGFRHTPAAPAEPGRHPSVPYTGRPTEPGQRYEAAPTGPAHRPAPAEHPTSLSPNPALSWNAAPPAPQRPVVTLGEPEGYDEHVRARPIGARVRGRTVAATACVVLGLGLIGGAATGSWLIGDSGETGARGAFATAGSLWHSVPVDQLFPPTVRGDGAGPGGADRVWTRIAVAPDSGCADAFDPLLRKALAPVGCRRLLRATYTDATRSHVTTVGLLFTKADATGMRSLEARFEDEALGRRPDLMPRPYAAKGTLAAGFGDEQRASWTVSVLTDAPVVVYAVSGWADARVVDDPQSAAEAMRSGVTTAVGQAGLGHEAKGLADRVERGLRKSVTSSSERPS
ncbi:hypothetical protein [Streptomyces cadmiisoli]|uniref:hypothetical protein n=1 Tax=Streptomyces cadmiisoli TaxID=2184053 RepID=UPI001FE5945A|nr:hypothetical protein [Streptomyces cadmiisoli]